LQQRLLQNKIITGKLSAILPIMIKTTKSLLKQQS